MGELLASRFSKAAAARPDAIAVVDTAGTTTYAELQVAAEAVARAVAPYGRIALLAKSDAASLAVALGAMHAGTSIVVLDRHLTDHQIERALTVTRPGLVVTPGGRRRTIHHHVDQARQRTPEALVAEGEVAPPLTRTADPEDELLVGLTSGTSGDPKLFARDQRSWDATLDRSDAAFDVQPGDYVSTPGPLDHSHYFYGALHALTCGATVDLRPVEAAFAPGSTATHVYVVPTLAVQLTETLGDRLQPTVRHVVSSAAAWPATARGRLSQLLPSATIHHFYGASELSFVALDSSSAPGPADSAGVPFRGVEIQIRDLDGQVLADGGQGIVHVRSDMLFSGYLTERDPFGGPDGDGWATVGDLGTLRDGRLWIAGRASDTIISGGINVEPADVEQALLDVPGVREIACVGLPDDRWGAIPVVALVVDPDRTPSRAAIRTHARETLPQPSRPWRVFTVDGLPRNRRGKLLRPDVVTRITGGEATEVL